MRQIIKITRPFNALNISPWSAVMVHPGGIRRWHPPCIKKYNRLFILPALMIFFFNTIKTYAL